MEEWRRDGRKEVVMVDLEALVPKEHLLRKIEKVMDYEWLYLYIIYASELMLWYWNGFYCIWYF